MNSNKFVFSVVRKTERLSEIYDMYQKALNFEIIKQYKDRDGYNGVILGHENCNYVIEFTNKMDKKNYENHDSDNYLVFYVGDTRKWEWICRSMIEAGFKIVEACNSYWNRVGKTFEDLDGNRVVIQNGELNM